MKLSNALRRRLGRPVATPVVRRATASVIESLEERRLLAAPELGALEVATPAPEGKTLFLPITSSDADGDDVALSATVTGPGDATATFLPDTNTFVDVNVRGFGTMTFMLFDDTTPEGARRFAGFADTGYYDNLIIPRVADGFVIQFGSPFAVENDPDPTDNLFSDPDYPDQKQEFSLTSLFTGDGQLSWANSGDDTNSTQVFITEPDPDTGNPPRFLDGNFEVLGQLVRGFDVRDAISEVMVVPGTERPETEVVIDSVRTVSNMTDGVLAFSADQTGDYTVTVTATDENLEQSTRNYTISVVAETRDSPAVILPFDTRLTTPVNTAITFDVPAEDPEGQETRFDVSLIDNTNGTVTFDDDANTVTFTPASGFTGPAEILISAATLLGVDPDTGEDIVDTRDNQDVVTVAVGDEEPVASGISLTALRNVDFDSVVVATFSDPDPAGTADNWSAVIEWGDGSVSSDMDLPDATIVEGPGGTFQVLGSHSYSRLANNLPVTVVITGDLGAQTTVNSNVSVVPVASLNNSQRLTVNGTSDGDAITVRISGSDYVVGVNGVTTNFAITDVSVIEINGREGDDDITLTDNIGGIVFAGDGDDTVTGSGRNDQIFGGEGDDVIDAGGGNDSIEGGAGNDYIMGGTGITYDADTIAAGYFDRDTILGGDGDDTLSGGLDDNLIEGGAGNDLLNGSGARDTLDGGEGNDRLRGYGNADSLIGGDGDDILLGDADSSAPGDRGGPDAGGNDTLEGGNGADVLRGLFGDDLLRGGAGVDSLFGGDGTDTDEDKDPNDFVDSDVEN